MKADSTSLVLTISSACVCGGCSDCSVGDSASATVAESVSAGQNWLAENIEMDCDGKFLGLHCMLEWAAQHAGHGRWNQVPNLIKHLKVLTSMRVDYSITKSSSAATHSTAIKSVVKLWSGPFASLFPDSYSSLSVGAIAIAALWLAASQFPPNENWPRIVQQLCRVYVGQGDTSTLEELSNATGQQFFNLGFDYERRLCSKSSSQPSFVGGGGFRIVKSEESRLVQAVLDCCREVSIPHNSKQFYFSTLKNKTVTMSRLRNARCR